MSSVRDPLYGIIRLTKTIDDVVKTDAVQRTKRIRQMGFMNHVFPSANHTRFEHLLGTMHITGLALEFLKMNERLGLDPHEEDLIKLAALLHDVGHGPFSHTVEELPWHLQAYFGYSSLARIDHEERTDKIIQADDGIAKILSENDRVKIVKFLSEEEDIGGIPGELITGDIGTDRMDYLNRDAYHSGLGHRLDVFSILPHLRLTSAEDVKRIAIMPEGLSAVELLVTARYHHFASLAHFDPWRCREFMLLSCLAAYAQSTNMKSADPLMSSDETTLISNLRVDVQSRETITKLEDGKGLFSAYSIRLNEIRSGLVRYLLYRTSFDRLFWIKIISNTTNSLNEKLPSQYSHFRPKVDFSVWKNNVPDVAIADNEALRDELGVYSVADLSALALATSTAQLLASKLNVWCEDKPTSEFIQWVFDNKSLIHSGAGLIAAYDNSESKLCKIDFLFLLLHSLSEESRTLFPEFKEPQVWINGERRLFEVIRYCQQFCHDDGFDGKDVFRFEYPEMFSSLNCLSGLNIIRMNIWGQKTDTSYKETFRQVYSFEVVDQEIQKKLLLKEDAKGLKDKIRSALTKYVSIGKGKEELKLLYGKGK